ncbi:MAG: hypothetical protein MJ128_03570 [Mogibacterium sp.]|nr:hypothetical protein [Mogibacterium sp.]
MTQNKRSIKLLIVISLIMLGVIYCLPMFMSGGIHKVDDTTFHVGRLVGLSNVWASPVNFNNYGNNGLMVNIFYPWLTMYPMYGIYKITGSYVLAYKLYYTLLTAVTLLIAYCSMHGISKNRAGARTFAVLYAFSSYRYADVYNRDALGESIALAFLPLVLLGIYKVCFENYDEWPKLAAGMTLVAYSHMLSLVMSAAFTGILFLIAIITQGSRGKRFAAMVKAACLSLGLSAAMIVPMMEQLKRNDLFMPSGDGDTMSRSAYSLPEIIRFTLNNNPAGRGVGLLCAAAVAGAVILLVCRTVSTRGHLGSDEIMAIWLLLIGAVLFIGTSDILPWKMLGDSTPLSTIQFVWRMNAYSTLAFTAAFSILLSKTMNSAPRGAIILLAAVVLVSSGWQYYTLHRHNAEMVSKARIAEEDIAHWASGNVDYTPYQARDYRDAHPDNMEFVFINGEEKEEDPSVEGNGSLYVLNIGGSEEDRTVDVPVFRLYGENVQLNGEPAECRLSERGTAEIKVPASKDAVITISYKYTKMARVAWAFSAVILLLSIVRVLTRQR